MYMYTCVPLESALQRRSETRTSKIEGCKMPMQDLRQTFPVRYTLHPTDRSPATSPSSKNPGMWLGPTSSCTRVQRGGESCTRNLASHFIAFNFNSKWESAADQNEEANSEEEGAECFFPGMNGADPKSQRER